MENDLYSFALRSTLNEIRDACPDIHNAFIFAEDGKITAADENTPERSIIRIVDAFEGLLEKAETLGGIELIAIEGGKGGANVSHVKDCYLVTITSENADKNYVNAITRTVVTTVLKLLDKISPTPIKNNLLETETRLRALIANEEETAEQPYGRPQIEKAEESELASTLQPGGLEPKANQLVVDDIQGLLVKGDTVRADKETLLQWQQLCGGRQIEEVEIETFGGQSTTCKIKPIKDSKQEGKGIIQVPNKIQRTLQAKKGELVRVKPLPKQEGNEP